MRIQDKDQVSLESAYDLVIEGKRKKVKGECTMCKGEVGKGGRFGVCGKCVDGLDAKYAPMVDDEV